MPSQHPGLGLSSKNYHRAIFFAAYILFGVLHELFHVAVFYSSSSINVMKDAVVSSDVLMKSSLPAECTWSSYLTSIYTFLIRAIFGRYTVVTIPSNASTNGGMNKDTASFVVTHSGWILSLGLAFSMHYLYCRTRRQENVASNITAKQSSSWLVGRAVPAIISAAYITAFESITSDLMGFVPQMAKSFLHLDSSSSPSLSDDSSIKLLLHCGNFGILLLNSQWINIDGGQRALSMLEKMVEVTMMRGAQSGGVVTFEPASGGGEGCNPVIKGVRSRVVNAKRTVLSKGIREKIEKDNCGVLSGGKLRGWDHIAFNATEGGSSGEAAKRLVRGFFGHTRFATTSKASFDGTHPHQWTPRQTLTCYGFQSMEGALKGGNERPITSDTTYGTRRASWAGMSGPQVQVNLQYSSPQLLQNVMKVKPKGQAMGVENFVTHNGKCNFVYAWK